ncbi:NUDIX hydrolase [Margalitia sp. FSL K6-0131]|uniref:NUDIX hydrolase n=1 Tax=Margalitia sp. FSL K6-0131 TaxID=2954604 RepID=UPI004046EF9B
MSQRYRACSLCIIWKDDFLLLEQFPEEEGIVTFRPVGGTIEYGEDSKATVIREVKEEINQDIIEPTLLGIIENIFPWYGEVGHEFDFIYESKFLYNNAYEREIIHGIEGDTEYLAVWKRISDFKDNPNIKLVPDGLYEMLINKGQTDYINNIKHINTKDILKF